MNRKNIFFTFLFFWGIFGNFYYSNTQDLDFYSRIDDAGNTIAENLTKRHLEEFSDFRNFAKHCRNSFGNASWLDTAPMNQEMLEDLSRGDIGKLQELASAKQDSISTEQISEIRSCLVQEYEKMKSQSLRQQKSLEDVGSTGIFMDGDTENSDFDIIEDINKINAIIFTKPYKYNGVKNPTQKSLLDFFKGKKAPQLKEKSPNSENQTSGNTTNPQKNPQNQNTNSQNNQNQTTKTEKIILPWEQICGVDGNTTQITSVQNMFDSDFARDLDNALSGKNNYNRGNDYSKHQNPKNNTSNTESNRGEIEENATNTSENDYFSKLPCSDTFCITFGSNISKFNALKGGSSFAIESILDKHIKRVNPISWGSLAGQKMTNNSYQLPFLNLKFNRQVSGGAAFLHNTPQVTSVHKETPANIEDQFENAYRCAMMEAGLNTDENKNAGILGASYDLNVAHTTHNFDNSTKPIDPLENNQNLNCQDTFKNNIERKHYEGFSTQVNEIQGFTEAMMDIINQILDSEKRLDTVKQI